MKNFFKLSSILVFSLLAFSQIASASYTARLDNPGQNDPEHLYFEAKPGDTITEYFTIANDDSPESLYIYAVDEMAQKTQQGDTAFKVKGDQMNEIGKWLMPEVDSLDLAPNETKSIKLTITIPENAEKKLYHGGLGLQNKKTGRQGVIVFSIRHVIKTDILVTDSPSMISKQLDTFDFVKLYLWISALLFTVFVGSTALSSMISRKK